MKKLFTFILLTISLAALSQEGQTCETAVPFYAAGTAEVIPNTINIPSSGSTNCLASTPSPLWLYIRIELAGTIDLLITMGNNDPYFNNLDVDFACWGPFNSSNNNCNALYDYPNGNTDIPHNVISCSYSTAATESFSINGTLSGEVYMILITNYSNNPGSITLTQTNFGQPDAGRTDASILNTNNLNLTNNSITVFPNPFSDFISFHFSDKKDEKYTISIYSMTGMKIIENKSINPLNGVYSLSLDKNFSSGMYVVKITNSKGVSETTLLVKE